MSPRFVNGVRRTASFAVGLALLVVLGWAVLELVERLGGPAGIERRFGLASVLLVLPLFAAPAIPGEFAGFVTVSIYGFAIGTPLVWLGSILRAHVEYGLSSRLRAAPSSEPPLLRLPRWLARFPADHPIFLAAGRWMPLGNHVVSVIAGLRGVPLRRFAWTSALGLAPFALLVAASTLGLVALHD
jgi:uncharacterized membrane protein YdjX (TVP38/TMEM64 family)